MHKVLSGLGLLLALTGCGQSAIVSSELPVERVVVYRNGVAYFERGGTVRKEEVRFKMRDSEVADFLGTLAIMEKGGSSVRAASFPIKVDEDKDEPEKPYHKKSAAEKRGLKDVVLRLDGKKHELRVGYVAASPVWRPSYRLLVLPNNQAQIQAWGVVENVSGEDWRDVSLTLVAGAPLAFTSQLGTPTIPDRPLVTDHGEVIAAVPRAETSYSEADASPPAPPVTEASDGYGYEYDDADEAEMQEAAPARRELADRKKSAPSSGRSAAGGAMRVDAAPAPAAKAASAPPVERVVPSAPRDLRSLAAVAQEGGTTRYDLPYPVTVPDKTATMVLLAAQPAKGEIAFLFATDPGVPDSVSHPFRVARFANSTAGALERGPIAVFEGSSFVGQGVLDPLPASATATVPFALERGIAVTKNSRYDEHGERIVRISHGQLTIERDVVQLTTYTIKSGLAEPSKVILKHSRLSGARLEKQPAGTEDNTGTGSALIPVQARASGTTEHTVDERTPQQRGVDWFSPMADSAFATYKKSPSADRALVQKLEEAWKIRAEVVKNRDARSKISIEEQNLREQTDELRRNLRAIEKNTAATQLRAQLTERLTKASARLDVLTKESVELDTKMTELGIRFRDAVREISWSAK